MSAPLNQQQKEGDVMENMRVADLHCDTILKCMDDKKRIGIAKNDFSIDLEKLGKANSLVQFFALFVHMKEHSNPMEYCLEMLDKFYLELEENKEHIAIARSYQEIMDNDAKGKLSALLTIEEGGVLKGELHNLRNFYRLGVRGLTLTWNFPNEIGYPNARYEHVKDGLTDFGKEAVYEMNRLGMLIDVSHMSDEGFYDVARTSTKPFIASHSNARTVAEQPRNLTDHMIRTLADKGGVTGINFERSFLGCNERGMVEDMVRHIKHIRNIGGIDMIALGSDYDGISVAPEMENIGEMYKLQEALERAGFTQDEIEKVFYRNALRVIKDVLG